MIVYNWEWKNWSTRPTHGHYFRTWCPSVRLHFQNLAKQNNFQVIGTGGTVGLAEWIIDGTHVFSNDFMLIKPFK